MPNKESNSEESDLRSTTNLLIVLCLMAFTLSCGIFEGTESGNSDSSENSVQNVPDDALVDPMEGVELTAEGESGDADSGDQAISGKDKSITVRFAKGRTSKSFNDTVTGDTRHAYNFGVTEGQRINVKVSSGDGLAFLKGTDPLGMRISAPDARETNFSEIVPETGNYTFEVVTAGDRSDYTVTFGATALPKKEEGDEPQPGGITKTVKFSKGRSSASYNGAVIRGDRDTYVLGAQGGQQMSVNISSVENNAVFQIRGPQGYLRGAEPGSDRTSWNGQLPANGNYRVIVGGTRGNATYTITFAIR
ncbi:MAG: hypothetical protein DWQ47_05585 [Acidobacteria bacterium]|nr:MAG: hypothetical protein DWQ32_09135 [Acidobacteriota bacterium]REK01851.1 MAG: hypothetical protein DWQ38_05570 [Acidobacteriota bacterium]REK14807.1 MAG: hypothetical protein DWQ43_14825 [Acidobacteriota bacterium]REK45522.1 MAG: hypothetical protein DWQ47_05585 [Acidobacteriota bacterium]